MENKNNLALSNNYGVYDSIFDNFFKFPSLKSEFKDYDKLMKTDIQETEKEYVLEIDMPGVKKEDINIELNNGYLTIGCHTNSTVTTTNTQPQKDNYIRRERFIGNIARTFYIGDIDEKCIKATLDSGVLNICMPKENCVENKKKIQIM